MGTGLINAAASLGARVVAGADPADEQRARFKESYKEAKVYETVEQLLADDEVQAVFVASPNHLHCEHTVAAAQARRHVFCEKPMALTAADCDRMIEACDQAGVKLMVGQVLRYIPDLCWALQLVRSGQLGRPVAVSIERLWGAVGRTWQIPWRIEKRFSGGWLYEVNVHEIDYMCEILGSPQRVYATTAKFIESNHDIEDLALATFHFPNGGVGLIQGGSCSLLGRYEVAVFCEKGDLFLDRNADAIRYHTLDGELVEQKRSEIPETESPVQREVREFLEAVTEDKPVTIPGHIGRRAIAAIEAAYRSAATGQPVDII